MKRDMELVRIILLAIADSNEPIEASRIANEKYSANLVGYHFQILNEAGLIVASVSAAGNNPYYFASASRLTWEGNDYLDAIRDESIWRRIKSAVAKATGTTTFDVVKTLASSLSLEAIKSVL